MAIQIRAFILIAVLLLQSLGMLGSLAVAQRAQEFSHLAVHSQSAQHHHHADQTLHLDDENDARNGGAAQHVHADPGVTQSGVLFVFRLALVVTRSASPVATLQAAWLSPTLDGPLRPPKHLA